jgi:hypothetical protein
MLSVRRAAALLSSAAAVFACSAIPASAADIGGFEGSDGNQICAAGIDWSCLSADWHLTSKTDGSGSADDVFSSSAKEDKPGLWQLQTGGPNDKTDILNVWSATAEPADAAYLALGFRVGSGGSSASFSFELNQTRTRWDNGMATIPCRTDGDVLVSYELPASIKLYKWAGSGGPAGCPDGAVGTWTPTTTSSTTWQAAINGSGIASTLPDAPATLDASTFGETILDLAGVASDVGISAPCQFFAGVQSHSRQSPSFSSSMSDFVSDAPINVAACKDPGDGGGGGDTTPPPAPTLAVTTPASCFTDRTVTLTGNRGDGSDAVQVQVRDNGSSVGVADVDAADGTWSLTLTDVADGPHTYTAVARDAAANASPASDATAITVDATPPAPPTVNAAATAGTVSLAGTAEPNTTLTVVEGGVTVATATADGAGAWSASFAATTGPHSYDVTAADACASSTATTSTVTVPSPVIPTPTSTPTPAGTGTGGVLGTTVTGVADLTEITSDTTPSCATKPFSVAIPGKGVKKVVFRVDGKTVRTVKKLSHGKFVLKLDPRTFKVGNHKITAKLTLRNGKTRVVPMRAFARCAVGQCVSRRAFRIHVKQLHNDRVVRAKVYVNGKQVKVLQGKRLSAGVKLLGLPKGNVTVTIKGVTAKGKHVTDVRHYKTCTKKSKTA